MLRWGIAAAGKISHDFAVALSTLPDDEHKIFAVAARDKNRAEDFAKLHGIPNAYDSYMDLAKSSDIDVAYIGVLNTQHFDVAKLMLENGKHVLCEKPLCMNQKQTKQLIQYAELKKLFLMEAVWSRSFPAYKYVRKQIETGLLGDITEVNASFGFDLSEVDRLQKRELGGGTVLDLGIYTIQVSQWAFQEPPVSITAKGELNDEKVDICVEAKLHYSGGRVANIKTSAKHMLDNQAVIIGTKGKITLLNFWCPTKLIDIDGKEKEWVLPKGSHQTNFPNSEGLRYEADEVRKCILEGKLQSESVSHNESLMFSQIEDEIRKQIGVVFNEDRL